jgi:glycerol-3-phosphate O-acyltransferase/dihydroxyacetone phosphate acyltransferase
MSSWVRRVLDLAVASFSRLLLRLFFREVEVVGRERLPPQGPRLLIANHVNSMVDPILVLGFLGVRPRILAKSTLWRHPVVAPLLTLAGAVPVYRKQDGVPMARNFDTLKRCREVLARGGTVLLFPEGTSHNHPHRLPLKTGAARIALETVARHGTIGLRIVPVGLNYEAKDKFGSRVLALIGEPLDPGPEAARYAERPREAVRLLTARMADALGEVTASHPTWEEARLVERGVDLLAEEPHAPLSQRFGLRSGLIDGYLELARQQPARALELVDAMARHDRALAEAGLTDADLEPPEPALSRRARLLLALPALVGTVLNFIPYRLPGLLSARLSRTLDEPATYKVLAALLFFPMAWLVEVALAWAWRGPWWGLGIGLLAPATGYAALLWVKGPAHLPPGVKAETVAALSAERARLREDIARHLEARSPEPVTRPREDGSRP